MPAAVEVAVGVVEQGSSALLVTVTGDKVLDRRLVELIEPGLSTHPHHHEGSWALGRYLNTPGARALPLTEAVALVERVRASALQGARAALEAVSSSVGVPIRSIALRACAPLPPTTEERIRDHRAQTMADSIMYRQALATTAEERGWKVHWYEREHTFRDAAAALGCGDIEPLLQSMGRRLGPPWQAKHRLAAAAALVALAGRSR